MQEGEGINQKQIYITHRHRQQCGDSSGGVEKEGGGRWRWAGGEMGMEGKFARGGGGEGRGSVQMMFC